MLSKNIAQIQACFPEIYFACHTRHHSEDLLGLTARDGTLLAHIAGLDGIETGALARHLGRAKSTLSAALKKLEALGLVLVERPVGDGRRRVLRITEMGREYVSRTSVLETERLGAVLGLLGAEEQLAAVRGLQILAAACRAYQGEKE